MTSVKDDVVFDTFEIITNKTNVQSCLQTNSNKSLVKHAFQTVPTPNL